MLWCSSNIMKLFIFGTSVVKIVFSDVSLFSHAIPQFDVIHNLLKQDGFISLAISSLIDKINLSQIPISQIDPKALQDITSSSLTTLSSNILPIYQSLESQANSQIEALQPKLQGLREQTVISVKSVFDHFLESNSHLIQESKPKVESYFLSLYDRLIEADPRLKLKTNEYISLVLQDDIKPRLESTIDYINQSPLVTDIRNVASRPTNEVAYEQLKPVGDFLIDLGGRVVRKLIAEPTVKLAENVGNVVNSIVTSASQELDTSVPNIPNFEININADKIASTISNVIPPASVFNEKFVETFNAFINEVGPRIELANNKFGIGLAESGNKFVSNINNVYESISQYSESKLDTVKDLKLVEIPGKFIGYIAEIPQGSRYIPTSTSPAPLKTASDYIDPIINSVTGIQEKLQKWQLFTDPNHWENGYWEQQITQASKLVTTLDENKFNEYVNNIQIVFDKAGQRFIERSEKPIAKYNQLINTINTFNTNFNELSQPVKEKISNFKLDEVKEQLQSINTQGSQLLSNLKTYSSDILKNGNL